VIDPGRSYSPGKTNFKTFIKKYVKKYSTPKDTDQPYFSLSSNRISDVAALAGLTKLTTLNLRINNISRISPLVDNLGLGDGDYVGINMTSIDCANAATLGDIAALESRGTRVVSDCY
jgi:hypothetical protein